MTTGTATLALVRHGESTYVAEGRFQGRHDPPLTALGERQASLVAARLADRTSGAPLPLPASAPSAVWHSPLRRAAHTAALIAAAQQPAVALRPSDGLAEIAQGDWEGQLLDDVRTRWPAELRAWRTHPAQNHAPDGESLADAAARVGATVEAVLSSLAAGADGPAHDPVPGYPSAFRPSHAEGWAVVVAHDGILRLLLVTLLGMPLDRFWSLPFNLCAITVVAVRDGAATLRAHNLSDHLAVLADESRQAADEARGQRRGAL